jgi:mono/diheme cytochrome c family protein
MARNPVRSVVILLALCLVMAACGSNTINQSQGPSAGAAATTAPSGGAAAASPTVPLAAATALPSASATTMMATTSTRAATEATPAMTAAAPAGTATTSPALPTGAPTTAPVVTATAAVSGTAAATPLAMATTAVTGTATTAPAAAAATAPAGTAAAPSSGAPSPALVQTGQGLYQQLGCAGCHSINGTNGVGPTFKGLYGSQVKLTNGQTVTADDAYIKQSIQQPNSQIVQGFQPNIMPNFSQLNDQQIQALTAYIQSLR